ncbi:adenosylcobinamide-GDP ribazoletransferase [Paracoccus sp. YLB-12]|uniref:Adenosylcobinamide-GDP ribazoletransferase n=1 Tax=Paracoccus maritimus TaxID=2933292 RepID=A0ABT2K6S1_9RHOB|nr:adenosylcobinamide-GDP ribazoletransferase [Paracoccus sp. YLB-12]MCT4332197.1 adenosylcobinamide-GDP ribazoletransferase [Paracoccus sp. YLB-12]
MVRRWHQFLLALVFLTRLPLGNALPPRIMPLAQSAWAFPLVGAVVGAIASLPLLLPGPPMLTAALSVALSVWLTGALHEDALADLADAGGGKDTESRLRIMRDSRIGSYGVMALILVSIVRVVSLTALGPAALIAAAASGRAASVLVMAALPPARSDGLGHAAGRPAWAGVAFACLTALVAVLCAGPGSVIALIAAILAIAAVIRQARIWLGGQSGDVLGSASILTETAILSAFAMAG